jgi:hypothetical protein
MVETNYTTYFSTAYNNIGFLAYLSIQAKPISLSNQSKRVLLYLFRITTFFVPINLITKGFKVTTIIITKLQKIHHPTKKLHSREHK